MSHHKTEALFLNYYLTGDDYGLQCGLEGANWSAAQGFSYANGPSDNILTYVRRWAHQMFDLVWAYEYNQSPVYFQRLWMNLEVFRHNIWTPANPNGNPIGQEFMTGLAMEALVKMYYILTPQYTTNLGVVKPDSIPHYLKIWCDRVDPLAIGTCSACYNPNVTIGYAFLSKFYGPTYQTKAIQKASSGFGGNLHKDFAQQWRNMEQAMYYFTVQDSVDKYSSVEASPKPALAVEQALNIEVNPTPFNMATAIRLSGAALTRNAKPLLKVYTLDGVLVKDLSGEVDNRDHSVVWNADSRTSNMYLVKCTIGNRVVTKKLTLLK
jgi:hypothetical protein